MDTPSRTSLSGLPTVWVCYQRPSRARKRITQLAESNRELLQERELMHAREIQRSVERAHYEYR